MVIKILCLIIVLILSLIICLLAYKTKSKKVMISFFTITCVFCLVYAFTSVSKRKVEKIIDSQIQMIEQKINEVNPELFAQEMDTNQINETLNYISDFSINTQNSTINYLGNMVTKTMFKRFFLYTRSTKNLLDYVGASDGTISLQELVFKTKEDVTKLVIATIYLVKTVIFIVYAIIAFFILFCIKDKKTEKENNSKNGIKFGEDIN